MPTTTNLILPYPADANPPDGPAGLGALAKTLDAFFGAMTPYTPAVVQLGAVTLSTVDAAYSKIGKLAEVRWLLQVSGTGTAANKITIAAPAGAPSARTGLRVCGGYFLQDTSTFSEFRGSVGFDAGSTTLFVMRQAAGLAGASGMVAGLANGDLLRGWARYETT